VSKQRFLGVGQGNHQGVIAPDPLVGQIHALLASSRGAGDGAVGIQDRRLEECLGLLLPNQQAFLVDDVHQRVDAVLGEPAEEIASGGRIGDTRYAQGIQIGVVIAE
jgi:hypothetical protein